MDLQLTQKTALVCGSTQGIGLAAAQELALLGARVILLARNADKLKAAVATLSPVDRPHATLVADFSDPEAVKATVASYVAENAPIHILVNNTGGPAGGPAIKAGVSEFLAAFEQHLVCNHHLVQTLTPGMQSAGYGRIINVISTSVKAPLNNLGVSNTIRGAVANWAKTLANELGQHNITVNNVLPGATDTVRLQSIAENKAAKTGKSVDEVVDAMAQVVPMKRVGKAEEIGSAIAFLASPAAGYINGINLPVDGGRTPSL
ncbi:MAG: SDR family oxidoreductase [Salibacteraceae bacterium]